jgi:hypothetical protein
MIINNNIMIISGLILLALLACEKENNPENNYPIQEDPPFHGTVFIDPDIITDDDSSTYISLEYSGRGSRVMFDRRVDDWITVDAYLFNVTFSDKELIEYQVNPEFGSVEEAQVQVQRFTDPVGRLPGVLKKDVHTVWIHKGKNLFGGGNNNLLIHIGQADEYIEDGILEEVFVHEAAHTSLDADHARAGAWQAAQKADGSYISNYARDYPAREDIAETFLPWLAVRYRSDRISESLKKTIEETVPKRLIYFDNQDFEIFPVE